MEFVCRQVRHNSSFSSQLLCSVFRSIPTPLHQNTHSHLGTRRIRRNLAQDVEDWIEIKEYYSPRPPHFIRHSGRREGDDDKPTMQKNCIILPPAPVFAASFIQTLCAEPISGREIVQWFIAKISLIRKTARFLPLLYTPAFIQTTLLKQIPVSSSGRPVERLLFFYIFTV